MSEATRNHDAHDYAERIHDRLARRLQELREAMGLSYVRLGSSAWHQPGIFTL
jgi:hypothetical protein